MAIAEKCFVGSKLGDVRKDVVFNTIIKFLETYNIT